MTRDERGLLLAIADKLNDDSRTKLRADIELVSSCVTSDDGSFISFELSNYQRPAYDGHDSFEFQGSLDDSNGVPMTALVNADVNGRLLEIEFLRWGEGGTIVPNWKTLRIVESPP